MHFQSEHALLTKNIIFFFSIQTHFLPIDEGCFVAIALPYFFTDILVS